MIVLNGGRGNVQVAGTLSASGKRKGTKGGTIEIAGENISVTGAKTRVRQGWRRHRVDRWRRGRRQRQRGGREHSAGRAATLDRSDAQTVSIDAATTINASALVSGNGGKVVVWSDSSRRSPD